MRSRCSRVAAAVAVALLVATAASMTSSAKASAAAKAPHRRGLLVSHCRFSHRAPDDPIVHSGMPGMSHLHDFFGNTSTDSDSTAESLLHGATDCRIAGDHAAYWAPTLYANGVAVTPLGMLAYYAAPTSESPQPLPFGLEMVAGAPHVVRFACIAHGMPRAQHTRPPACGPKELLSIAVRFPECWNGVDLDSTDHRSHMAYATNHVCPSSHPVAVPQLTMWMLYPRQLRGTLLTMSSGALDTMHADFYDEWATHDYRALHTYCLTDKRICYKLIGRVLRTLHLAHT